MSDQYIKYEPQLRVMICQLCPEGVSKNSVALHYRKRHRDLDLRIRKELVKYANNFDQCEPNELQHPTTIVPHIEGLAVQQGVRCLYDNCNEAYLLPSSMEKHCEEAHGWITSKGTIIRLFFLTLCVGVMWAVGDVQTVFKGPFRKYFPVCTMPLLNNPELDALLQQSLAQASLNDIEEERRNNTIVPEANERADPWMSRGEWLTIIFPHYD
jgi:hypothetical protein